ncbi:MAG: patatin-like phospholipase family protein [Hyphomicrobiaceae bacterium]
MSKSVTRRDRSLTRTAMPRIGLALGGGGARGLAHILMLEVFDELGIRPAVITGTSIGAVYGAAYAAGLPAKLIRAHTEEALSQRFDLFRQLFSARADPVQKLFNLLPMRSALLNPEALLELMLPSKVPADFADLVTPLAVVATDFYAQEPVILAQGPLRRAVAASIALPAIFQPVVIAGRPLMDGGLVNPLPFDLLQGAADITIAIDVSGAAREAGTNGMPSAFEAIFASSQILQRSIVREKLKSAQPDIYIDAAVDRFQMLEFHRFREIFEASAASKEALKKQLGRLLGAETVTAAPAMLISAPKEPAEPPATSKKKKPRRLLPRLGKRRP